ncbi:MAG: class I SAM-dependent methyltransferase [Hyphomicrobiales bacterium]
MSSGGDNVDASGYAHKTSKSGHHHPYLRPTVLRELAGRNRIFDLGCGNGSFASVLNQYGFDVTGVDPSLEEIAEARKAYPSLKLHSGSAYDNLAALYGEFDAMISLEVIEHIYDPRSYARTLFSLVKPEGIAIVSTPYHGYIKNVAIALSGAWDRHHTVLWPHGHIKFWSIATLSTLLSEAGFIQLRFERIGRIIPSLAKSMVAVASTPLD